jgi:hypothetical protein
VISGCTRTLEILLMDTSHLNRELAAFDAEVDRFESEYEAKADGKAGMQKGMDAVRSLFNRGADGKGYGDDQWKNIANTQHGLDRLKADMQSGRLDAQQAQQALAQLRQNFEGEADRVEQAQAGNARVGQAVHGAGRMAAVGAAGIAGTVAGGGVNVVAGAAAAVAAGSAYDALTVGAGAADKKLGNGGNAAIAPSLDTHQSVGGLAAGAWAGQEVQAKDVVQAGVGTALDAVSGGFAGQGVKAARASIAAAQSTRQVAQAAATASVKTGLQQSAATLGVQTAGTAIDPSQSAERKRDQIVQQGKDTLTQLPGQIVFGAASGAAGAVVQPANKLLDGAAQVAIDGASNLGEASTGNVLSGKGPALGAEQFAQAAVMSSSGALHNVQQRGTQDAAGFKPVSDQELRQLHPLPARELDALLGSHKKNSLAQTMRAGGIDSTLRPIEEPLGSIVLQSRGPLGPPDDGFGAAPIDEHSPPPRQLQQSTGPAPEGFGAAPIDEQSPPRGNQLEAGWPNVTDDVSADAPPTTQAALPPATPPDQKALPGSRQYRVFTHDPRPEVRGQPNRLQGTQVRTVDVYAPGTQPRQELRRNAAFNLGGNTPTYGALQSSDLAKVLDKTHTIVLRDQPTDFARALSTVDPDHGGIAGSAYWGNVVSGGRFASDATPPLGAERQLTLKGVAPTLAGQSFQLSRELGQAELGGYNTNTAGEGVANLYRSLGFEVVPEAIGVVDPGLRFNGADGGNHSLMRYHIRRDLSNGQVPSPSRFSQGNAQQPPFAAGHAITVPNANGHVVPLNHRLPDNPPGGLGPPPPTPQPPGPNERPITSSQDILPFDQLARSDMQLGLGSQLREFHRDWKLLPEIASLSYQQHVAAPLKSLVNETLIEPIAQSTLGQAVGRQRDLVSEGITQAKTLFDQSAPGRLYSRSFGRAFNALDRYVVRNPGVWKSVDGVAKQMSNAVKIGGVATLAANRIMAGNGTLITGTAVSGDPNAPREAIEAARSGNVPKGMTFHYEYAPLPLVPTARAITTVGAKDGIFVPPATGGGQVGTASPWVGFKPNGADPGSKEMVATASAIAALGDVEASYNIGSTNFNLGLKAFGLAGRLGANVPRFEARNDPVAGQQNAFDVRALLSFDPLQVGATGTVNLGPLAVTVERPRLPMTVKGATGSSSGDNWFDPFAPGHKSNIKPLFSPVSTTYDPQADDMQAIQQLLDQARAVRLGVPQFEPAPDVQGPHFRGLELEEVKRVIDGREQTVGIVGTGPIELDAKGDIVSARGKRYELLEPDGSPITDLDRARERAQELIRWQAATDLTYDQADKLQADREAFTEELNALINRLPKDTRLEAADAPPDEQHEGTEPR